MKKPVHPGVIAGCVILAVVLLGFILYRGTSGGPTVEGVESMPPDVRKAFTGANRPHQTPPPNR